MVLANKPTILHALCLNWYFKRNINQDIYYPIPFWIALLHNLWSHSSLRFWNGFTLTQDAAECILSRIFFLLFPLFPSPYLLSQSHSFLTCACLCPCVLHPGIKRNTVWTQPMPSKFLAASWLHGMEYLKLSATNKTHTSEYLLWICLRFGYICI